MTPADRALRERLRRRVAADAPAMQRRVLAAYDMIRQSLSEREWAEAVANGNVEALIAELLSDNALDPAVRSLRVNLDQMTMDASRTAALDLPPWARGPAFNVLNPRVVEAIQGLSTRVVRGLGDNVRETVRAAVRDGLERGLNPRAVAKGIRETVGLSQKHVDAVARFRQQLEDGDRAALRRMLARGKLRTEAGTVITRQAHAGGEGLTRQTLTMLERKLGREPLTPGQIDRAVEAYRKRLEAWHAETQARSATLDAHRLAQRMSWEDAMARGVVDRAEMERTWVTVGDNRVRAEHEAMNGQTIPFDGVYSNGNRVPGESDYNCRCMERYSRRKA